MLLIFGRPFVKQFTLCYRTVVLSVCLSVLSVSPVCNVGVLWPKGWMDQDETWRAGRPRPWLQCVRWGPSFHSPKGHNRRFSARICCGQMAGWIKLPLGMEVGLCPGDFVLHGDPASPPQFSARVYCGQTAGWIKMPLGMELGLGPGHIVLDGDPTPPPQKKGA